MSGICGIVRLDGANARASELAPVLEQMSARGPDRSATWSDGSAALGHALLATTPEALAESLPLSHSQSGCTITADARLDNRDELMGALGLLGPGRVIGDGELILHAYLKWGDDCPGRLAGDFAFAIWDARKARLFCARDHIGMRQLAYCQLPNRAFVFATEVEAVVRHREVPNRLNLGRIGDFLDHMEGFSLTETFYARVCRLPPASRLILDGDGLSVGKYWQLAMPPELRLKSDEDYVDAFLDVFGAAVSCRLRSAGPVGSMLSGGMDSGSVSAVAAEILARSGRGPLATFSAVGREPASCPETRAIRASSQVDGIAPHFVTLEFVRERQEDLLGLASGAAEPFDRQMNLPRAVYLAAHEAGMKVLLDGIGGDVVFSPGNFVGRLLRAGKPVAAWREAADEARFWSSPLHRWGALARGAWAAWAPARLQHLRRDIMGAARDRRVGRFGLVTRDFAGRMGLVERRRTLRRSGRLGHLERDQRARAVDHPNLIVGRERYDRVAAAVGIEPRDPFLDLRVVQFCLSLPLDQLQAGGWPKVLLRRAMAGKLPDDVRWRRGREHLGFEFTKVLWGGALARVDWQDVRRVLSPFVRPKWFGGRLGNPASPEDCHRMVDIICLYQWLKLRNCEFSR